MTRTDGTLSAVSIEDVHAFTDHDSDNACFALAGKDGTFCAASARLDGPDAVVVQSDCVAEPAFARYAWRADPHATLSNAEGLPAGPFRTDAAPLSPMFELHRHA